MVCLLVQNQIIELKQNIIHAQQCIQESNDLINIEDIDSILIRAKTEDAKTHLKVWLKEEEESGHRLKQLQ